MRHVRMIICLLTILRTAAAMGSAADTSDYPHWMRDAVIYGIKPTGFVKNGTYDNITAKIPELKQLGINTIWLQPVFKTGHGGQGYDVIDFFSLRSDAGTASQLKNLVTTAKANGIRTLFDFVPNHTSIDHPYALDCIQKGKASPYYDYYQRENDGAPYSSFYHKDENGFIYYFWKDLVNLNYDNEKVQQMIIDACKYWVREYGIDGYRFDAVWAVNARAPGFGKRLRSELKALKPDILLLAEDKGRSDQVYTQGFDAAYDWTADTSWVSQWSWQYKHDPRISYTVFNHPDVAKRKILLSQSLFTNTANGFRVLRFLENNDLPRFITAHSLQQTKMAAGILFSLPGIPLMFCGQEIGTRGHPYSRQVAFDSARTIRQQDSLGLFSFYRDIINKRLAHDALKSNVITEIPVGMPSVVAYRRQASASEVIVVANLDSVAVTLNVPDQFSPKRSRKFREILSGKKITLKAGMPMTVPGFGILWLVPAGANKSE